MIKSWPQQSAQIWELCIPRRSEDDYQTWTEHIVRILTGLRIYTWCVNCHDLINIFQMPLDKALQEWGALFWHRFQHDSVFYFKAENDAELIREVLLKWHKNETTICFRNRYDLTVKQVQESVQEQETATRNRLLKLFKTPFSMLKPGKN